RLELFDLGVALAQAVLDLRVVARLRRAFGEDRLELLAALGDQVVGLFLRDQARLFDRRMDRGSDQRRDVLRLDEADLAPALAAKLLQRRGARSGSQCFLDVVDGFHAALRAIDAVRDTAPFGKVADGLETACDPVSGPRALERDVAVVDFPALALRLAFLRAATTAALTPRRRFTAVATATATTGAAART